MRFTVNVWVVAIRMLDSTLTTHLGQRHHDVVTHREPRNAKLARALAVFGHACEKRLRNQPELLTLRKEKAFGRLRPVPHLEALRGGGEGEVVGEGEG